jgi:drug/metabolite transporter (DMT)-like permease
MSVEPQKINQPKTVTPAGLIHLIIVYIVWGSTYLAIRIAVREGAGFPPFTMALMRMVAAAAILLVWARITGKNLRLGRREMGVLLFSGLLLWTGGNGLVTWAEQRAESGIAALVVASLPIWVAIIEAAIDRKRPTALLIGSLLAGFAGIGVLTVPVLQEGLSTDLPSFIALVFATISWAFGTVLQSRNQIEAAPRVSSAYQMLGGAIGFVVLVLIFREPLPAPIPEAWLAWGYLVIFGAALAFTSFVTILQTLPTNIVMTYAYVNPVIAVLLGWLILGEAVTVYVVAGSVLVLLGVYGVFRERYQARKKN